MIEVGRARFLIGVLLMANASGSAFAGVSGQTAPPSPPDLSSQEEALIAEGEQQQCQAYASLLKMWFGGGVQGIYTRNKLDNPGVGRNQRIQQVQQYNPFAGVRDPATSDFLSKEFRLIRGAHNDGDPLDLDGFYRRCLQFVSRPTRVTGSNNQSESHGPIPGSSKPRAKSRSGEMTGSSDPYASRR
ncbi:hypothetical protein EZI54_07465 [Marinobacter halodurans]|uniref:Uncharacterized protein n=1 Tax=Marinobacter halodurans TaxID=2528979 RepID=A0ABY1ZMF8_9GAMM|nr:hypothetical protein [Marinobacter halodurans]TBW57490.1 hypothetical protein EZI54_07465 [Marinobacter halodurans]